ncbi:hypothetical protein BUALT_Bualt18G0028700 [Buddleja alternifolia]|uniref:Retrotransposon gag domain-containing protein n=1 Tax=Buddleja alternifolia TaxID=168488 RepID=A0AAV6WA10_9LAMI|nr:hypothetical protein BUALT_Bualt18G0028700 [Buddleja alternifolia]
MIMNLTSKIKTNIFDGGHEKGASREVYHCEQFFEEDETPLDAKVKLATVHLEGKALQWHQIFMKARLARELPNSEEYVRALSDRFGVYFPENYTEEMETEELKEDQEEVCEENKIEEENVINYHVSMNAMTDIHDFRTMRVSGTSQGDIKWNFNQLKMEFTMKGQKVSLRGMQPASIKLEEEEQGSLYGLTYPSEDTCSKEGIELLLEEFAVLFEH